MCLYTRQIMPIKARRDITCFKVVMCLKSQNNLFFTPFQHMRITIGEICCAVGPLMPRQIRFSAYPASVYCIEDGYIHAFTNEQEAREYCKMVSKRCANLIFCVMECTIPKDTLYFVSAHRDYEICARNILPTALLGRYQNGCRKSRDK